MRNYLPERPSGAPLYTLSKLYDIPVGFVTPTSCFEAMCCFKRKRKRSYSVLWPKPLHPQKKPKSNVTTQNTKKRHQTFDYTTIADRLWTVAYRCFLLDIYRMIFLFCKMVFFLFLCLGLKGPPEEFRNWIVSPPVCLFVRLSVRLIVCPYFRPATIKVQ